MTSPLTGPTPEMLTAFAAAAGWPEPPDNPGVDVSRGMTAVFAILTRDYDIRPRQAAPQCPACTSPYPHRRFELPVMDDGRFLGNRSCFHPWHNAAAADTTPADVPHCCGNCEGVDPASCINTNGRAYTTPGARHCRCTFLGEGTPEHDASALCVGLRPDADRDPEPAGKCWDCTKGRHGICTGRDDVPPAGTGGACSCMHAEDDDRDPEPQSYARAVMSGDPAALAAYTAAQDAGTARAAARPPFEVEIKGLPVDPEAWCVSCNHPHPAHVFSCAVARSLREYAPQPRADHPHTDPGDGRTECPTCGKFVWLVTHSCKGVPVTVAARARWDAAHPASAATDNACPDEHQPAHAAGSRPDGCGTCAGFR